MKNKNSENKNSKIKKIEQAIIFCAGKSTRTWPLTITKPKPLLKIANKEILSYNIDTIKEFVNEILIVIGYHKEQIIDFVNANYINEKNSNLKNQKLNIKFIEQKELNGTGSALLSVKDHLKDRFIVMNGDDI
ncbi:MAG: sugar phosphate nucleotidyltransferase, partial [Candidatus Woesearchaeota archaeon]